MFLSPARLVAGSASEPATSKAGEVSKVEAPKTTPVSAVRRREDKRPLYRRIFTNRRLDIAHKVSVRTLIGGILFGISYCAVNAGIYYWYVRPVKQEAKEQLERELIEADRAGFLKNKL